LPTSRPGLPGGGALSQIHHAAHGIACAMRAGLVLAGPLEDLGLPGEPPVEPGVLHRHRDDAAGADEALEVGGLEGASARPVHGLHHAQDAASSLERRGHERARRAADAVDVGQALRLLPRVRHDAGTPRPLHAARDAFGLGEAPPARRVAGGAGGESHHQLGCFRVVEEEAGRFRGRRFRGVVRTRRRTSSKSRQYEGRPVSVRPAGRSVP
jgi:hypothetical protein